MKQILFSSILLVLICGITANAQTNAMGKIKLLVTDASSDKGNMIIGLYSNEKEW